MRELALHLLDLAENSVAAEARAITNLIGNGVATIVVARWEKEFDLERARRILGGMPFEQAAHGETTARHEELGTLPVAAQSDLKA